MNEVHLTEEQKKVFERVSFSFGLLKEEQDVVDLLKRLSDAIPNNYEFGETVRNLIQLKNKSKKVITNGKI